MIYILLLTFIHIIYRYNHIVGIENNCETSVNQLIFGAMDNKENIEELSKKKLLYKSLIEKMKMFPLIRLKEDTPYPPEQYRTKLVYVFVYILHIMIYFFLYFTQ